MTTEALPCGYTFAMTGGRCGTLANHAVHLGTWAGPEPRHNYQPEERRQGERRVHTADLGVVRAIVTSEVALDVAALIAELSESPLPGARYAVAVVKAHAARGVAEDAS